MAGAFQRLRFGRRLSRAMRGQLELAVLRAGFESGFLEALSEPRTSDELALALGTAPDLTLAWLRAALAHELLTCSEGRYRNGGYVAWLQGEGDGAAALAMIGQATESYTPTLARLPELLRGAERPTFGADPRETLRVAAGSRVSEPAAIRALFGIPGVRAARRILDVGCGEGTYLAELLTRHRDALGTGIEKDPAVAERARQKLRVREVSRRAQIEQGDVLELALPRSAFELVLLNNNLHYFADDARRNLLERVHACLTPGGVLAIQTPLVSDTSAAKALGARAALATFDLYLRCHENLHGLPHLPDLKALLEEVGFEAMALRSAMPGGMAVYVHARKAGGES